MYMYMYMYMSIQLFSYIFLFSANFQEYSIEEISTIE